MLHYTIQYAMGPWQCYHLHQFVFEKRYVGPGRPPARDAFSPRDEVLRILPADLFRDDVNHGSRVPREEEKETLKLSDVFDPAGRLHSAVLDADGAVCPLIYTYDLGVSGLDGLWVMGPADERTRIGQLGAPTGVQRA